MSAQRAARRWLIAGLRFVVCVGALWWVLHNVTWHDYVVFPDGRRGRVVQRTGDDVKYMTDAGVRGSISVDRLSDDPSSVHIEAGLASTARDADKLFLLVCVAVFIPVPLIQSWRFKLLLGAQGIEITFFESAKLCYAGNFLNYVTALGTTGGDVFKMYYVSLHTEHKTEAVATVIIDRVFGLLGLVLVVAAFIVWRWDDERIMLLRYGIGAIVLGLVVLASVFFSRTVRDWLGRRGVLDRLPGAGQIRRIDVAVRRLREQMGVSALALVCTLVLQGIGIMAYTLSGAAVGMNVSLATLPDYYAYLAAGLVVAAIPVSFQGLGTMEAFFVHAFLGTHGSLASILCLAMAIRVIGLFWSLPGAVVAMTGAYRPRIGDDGVQFA